MMPSLCHLSCGRKWAVELLSLRQGCQAGPSPVPTPPASPGPPEGRGPLEALRPPWEKGATGGAWMGEGGWARRERGRAMGLG